MSFSPIQLRHQLHRNPELAFEEVRTTNTLLQNIRNLEGSKRLKFHSPMDTGLLVEYTINDEENFTLTGGILMHFQSRKKIILNLNLQMNLCMLMDTIFTLQFFILY